MSDPLKVRDDGIRLRFATTDDKEAIYAFALEAIAGATLPAFAEDAGENLQERIEQGDPRDVLIAEDTNEKDKIVAYFELDPKRSKKPGIKYIRGIYVLPEYRRRGIGKECLSLIRKHSVDHHIQLRVDAFTQEGLKFWKNYGFKVHHYSLYHDN